jgi:uncharacterized membrane protein
MNKQGKKNGQQRGNTSLLNHVIQDNIQSIIEHRKQAARNRTLQEKIADGITVFSGSMRFVILHVVWFGAWIILNSGWVARKPFDPFPYGLLTMIVSLEAIFLSTFVLISQNRMSKQDKQRAELDLQINLLTEHELTRVLQMLDEIQDHMGIENDHDKELIELEKETKPEDVMKEIERKELGEREKKSSV